MKGVLLACVAVAAAMPAAAADINTLQLLAQAEFRRLSEDATAVLSYKALLPAEPLGVLGFDLGVATTFTQLRNVSLWNRAAGNGDFSSTVVVPTLRAHKGLPGNVDIGISYGAVPDSNVRFYGGELRWAVLEGSALTPAVALRGAFSRLQGVDQLKFDTQSLDISVSKGFALLTPYAGIGQIWSTSTPQSVPGLTREKFSQGKIFAGLNINFALVNIAFEVDRTGDATSGGVKLGFRF